MLIEDYALLSNLETAALVGRDGSIDWLCFPRFDSGACFAALLGDESHGRWLLAPAGGVRRVTRRYRPGTLVLETEFETDEGAVRVVDCMPPDAGEHSVVRVVEGLRGSVPMRMQLVIRLDYGSVIPWVTNDQGALHAVAGPDALRLWTYVETRGEDYTTVAEFEVRERDRVPFLLDWHWSHLPAGSPVDALHALARTERFWEEWSERCTYEGAWNEPVRGSLAVLKGLTYGPTGGIVAAPTTSLPEALGGERNWDYRYCWLRDAALTLGALLRCGYIDEGLAFREWVLRATAGHPREAQIMYGVAGERRLTEYEVDWLPGYEGSRPVRVGNQAAGQFQLDVFGEVMDAGHVGRLAATARGISLDTPTFRRNWRRNLALMRFLEDVWHRPDEGIWEVRGPSRAFTHSRVMAWVAFDRAVRAVEEFGLEGPVDEWKARRDEIHAEVCRDGFDTKRGTFTQYYGSKELDASLLLLPAMGFLPPDDPRILGTVDAVRRELCEDGFVYRYTTGHDEEHDVDGLRGKEGVFLPCSFWLVDALAMTDQTDDARVLFERLLGLRNDLGLLAEEYDVAAGRLVGNFPQAFTHLALVGSALRLDAAGA
jgi:GH15 family glucan-1,4-alpha-glucosidase